MRRFEILAAPIDVVSEAILKGNFINGLRLKIQAKVRMLRPKGLGQTMEVAQGIEERN